jgi:hypothetical protein
MTSEVNGQTAEGYDKLLVMLSEVIRDAPGFIMHAALDDGGTWRLVEVWETKADADQFFVNCVVPYLPADIRPKRTYQELHSLLQS